MTQWIRFGGAAVAALALTGCPGGKGPADVAAAACAAQVATQLESRPFRLDNKVLAANMTDDGRGHRLLTAPVLVDAGLANQDTQQLECTVELAADGSSATVLNLRFIW